MLATSVASSLVVDVCAVAIAVVVVIVAGVVVVGVVVVCCEWCMVLLCLFEVVCPQGWKQRLSFVYTWC